MKKFDRAKLTRLNSGIRKQRAFLSKLTLEKWSGEMTTKDKANYYQAKVILNNLRSEKHMYQSVVFQGPYANNYQKNVSERARE